MRAAHHTTRMCYANRKSSLTCTQTHSHAYPHCHTCSQPNSHHALTLTSDTPPPTSPVTNTDVLMYTHFLHTHVYTHMHTRPHLTYPLPTHSTHTHTLSHNSLPHAPQRAHSRTHTPQHTPPARTPPQPQWRNIRHDIRFDRPLFLCAVRVFCLLPQSMPLLLGRTPPQEHYCGLTQWPHWPGNAVCAYVCVSAHQAGVTAYTSTSIGAKNDEPVRLAFPLLRASS